MAGDIIPESRATSVGIGKLDRLFHYCSARKIPPDAVDDNILHVFNNALITEGAELESAAARSELAALTRRLNGLIDAIADGLRTPGLQNRLEELEAQRTKLEGRLAATYVMPRPVDPNLSMFYRQEVDNLRAAPSDSEQTEARGHPYSCRTGRAAFGARWLPDRLDRKNHQHDKPLRRSGDRAVTGSVGFGKGGSGGGI
jgi:hypothetical protein